MALLALNIKSGDEVIVPSFVCSAVLNAVLYSGARPKLADINPGDFNLSLKDTKDTITGNTKAIILPHMFGKPADAREFLRLGVPLIENCAHSLGARYKGKPTGCFGDISIFSFYATKMIATGYGGMVCPKSPDLFRRIKDLIDVDERDDYKIRFNYRMSDIAASMGMNQLKKLDSFISGRRLIAEFYNKNLKSKNISIPADTEKNHIYFRYVVRVKDNADRVIAAMNKNGVEAKKPIFKPLHRYLRLDKKRFPVTEAMFNSAISLPIYPVLKMSEAKLITRILNKVAG